MGRQGPARHGPRTGGERRTAAREPFADSHRRRGERRARPGETGTAREEGKHRRPDRQSEVPEGRAAAADLRPPAQGPSPRPGARPGGARQVTGALLAVSIAIAQAPATAPGAPAPASCATLARHGRRADAQACYTSLTRTTDHYLRAEGFWGLEQYQDANNEFREAVAQNDKSALYRVRWGRLMHERF